MKKDKMEMLAEFALVIIVWCIAFAFIAGLAYLVKLLFFIV